MELRTTVATENCNREERKGGASRQIETSLISLSLSRFAFSAAVKVDAFSVSGGRTKGYFAFSSSDLLFISKSIHLSIQHKQNHSFFSFFKVDLSCQFLFY